MEPRNARSWLGVAVALAAAGQAMGSDRNADPLDAVRTEIRLKNFAAAAEGLRRLAEGGNVTAQYRLGIFYLNGLNGPRDPAQARIWLTKAAQQGLASATATLRAIDADHTRLPTSADLTDPQLRSEALWRAAERGDVAVINTLVDPKTVNARDSFGRGSLARAAASGHAQAVDALIRLVQEH